MRQARTRQITVGVVVEGQTEFLAIPYLHTAKLVAGCPPLKVLCCNGIGGDVEAAGVARRVLPKVLQHIVAERNRVVVCIDRETREICAPGFANAVQSALDTELHKLGHHSANVTIVVADRAFETWLLADATGLYRRGHLKNKPTFVTFEGRLGRGQRCGKAELKDLLGREYSETRDGPRLFCQLDFASARTLGAGLPGSRSLHKFLRAIGV